MDFLDSVDWDASKYKKSHRVRSWYLYEQFKSLERNQLDATRKLKSRTSQDTILKRELSERKARRKLCNQFEQCTSDSVIDSSVQSESTRASLNGSIDNFFESFRELQDEDDDLTKICVQNLVGHSQEISQCDNNYNSNFGSSDKPTDNYSETESVVSVVNIKSDENISQDVKKYLESEQEIKLEDVEISFKEVDQKLQCLERLALMTTDFDKLSESNDISYSKEENEFGQILKHKDINTRDNNNINLLWSKVVSFAYQIMELNHGNCYYDYGSQLLTAVLACDVLRRGINTICHILQPYVSPIKFAADFPVESHINTENPQRSKHCKRKRYDKMINQNKSICRELLQDRNYRLKNYWDLYSPHFEDNNVLKYRPLLQDSRNYQSNNYWGLNYSPDFVEGDVYECNRRGRQKSEPWQSSKKPKQSGRKRKPVSKPSCHSIGCNFSIDNVKKRSCRITQHLDTIMKDIDHFVY